MRSSRQPRSAHGAGHAPGPGGIVRSARVAQGLSLAEFGARVGYSAAQVSRYERGIAPLTDIAVLRRFARALSIPPHVFGLVPSPAPGHQRHSRLVAVTSAPSRGVSSTVAGEPGGEDDEVRRRQLLASLALTAAGAVGAQATGAAHANAPGEAGLADLLISRVRDAMLGLVPGPSAESADGLRRARRRAFRLSPLPLRAARRYRAQ